MFNLSYANVHDLSISLNIKKKCFERKSLVVAFEENSKDKIQSVSSTVSWQSSTVTHTHTRSLIICICPYVHTATYVWIYEKKERENEREEEEEKKKKTDTLTICSLQSVYRSTWLPRREEGEHRKRTSRKKNRETKQTRDIRRERRSKFDKSLVSYTHYISCDMLTEKQSVRYY